MLVLIMSIAEIKEKEKGQRRAYIVEAAERLFFSKGYDGVSMNDIAGALEMNKATLYLYFRNKDSLYFAVLNRGLLIMRDELLGAAKKNRKGLDRIIAMNRAFFAYCREHPEHYRELCYARARCFDMSQVECAAEQMAIAKEIIGGICDAVALGLEDGTIVNGVDPLETAVFIISTCENIARPGQVMEWALSEGRKTHEDYMAHSMGLITRAIAARPKEVRS